MRFITFLIVGLIAGIAINRVGTSMGASFGEIMVVAVGVGVVYGLIWDKVNKIWPREKK